MKFRSVFIQNEKQLKEPAVLPAESNSLFSAAVAIKDVEDTKINTIVQSSSQHELVLAAVSEDDLNRTKTETARLTIKSTKL